MENRIEGHQWPIGLKLLRDLRSYYHGSRDRDQSEFYDLESSLPYFDQVSWILGRHKRQVILEFLLGSHTREEPLLEVGCGIGTLARVLARRGEWVIALDISARKIARAPGLGSGGSGSIDYHVGDLRELGQKGPLDAALRRSLGGKALGFRRIIACDVLEHLPIEPAETVRKLRDLLLPGGQLIASVPSRLCLGDPGHIWRLLPADWEEVFRASGLRVLGRRMSRIYCYRLRTPLPLAMVFDLRRN